MVLPARLGARVLLLGLTGPPDHIYMAFAASWRVGDTCLKLFGTAVIYL